MNLYFMISILKTFEKYKVTVNCTAKYAHYFIPTTSRFERCCQYDDAKASWTVASRGYQVSSELHEKLNNYF